MEGLLTRAGASLPAAVAALLVALAGAAPAAADWLVTRGGVEIETRGGWKVRGSLVVFTSASGRLSSIRADEVDFEASRARDARPPEAPAETAPPAPRKPVLVLTDRDVRHVPSRPAGEGPGSRVSGVTTLEVTGWQDRVDVERNALEISGSVVNRGTSLATDNRVEVRLLDRSGELLQRRRATLDRPVLAPGARAGFNASFPGNPGYATVEFDLRSRGFELRPSAQEPADAGPDQ